MECSAGPAGFASFVGTWSSDEAMTFWSSDGASILRRLQATASACPKCGAQISVEVGQRGAMARHIERSDVVVCPRCARVYTTHLVPGRMRLLEDVTATYPKPRRKVKCSKCGDVNEGGWMCPHCGYKNWGGLWFLSVVASLFVLIGRATDWWTPLRVVLGTLGLLGLLVFLGGLIELIRKHQPPRSGSG